jgi:hypothetical protein
MSVTIFDTLALTLMFRSTTTTKKEEEDRQWRWLLSL